MRLRPLFSAHGLRIRTTCGWARLPGEKGSPGLHHGWPNQDARTVKLVIDSAPPQLAPLPADATYRVPPAASASAPFAPTENQAAEQYRQGLGWPLLSPCRARALVATEANAIFAGSENTFANAC